MSADDKVVDVTSPALDGVRAPSAVEGAAPLLTQDAPVVAVAEPKVAVAEPDAVADVAEPDAVAGQPEVGVIATVEGSAGEVQVPDAPSEIVTLVAPPTAAGGVQLDPRTGEPVRPIAVGVGAALSWLSVAASATSLLWTYWVAVDHFADAAWLFGQFVTEQGSMLRIGLAAGLTAAVLLAMIANTIVGFYAWTGYRWTRIAGLIGAGLSLVMLLGGRFGWAAIPLAFVGAGMLWLPSAKRYFEAWWQVRHPSIAFAPPTTNVQYGPLPRYR